MKFQTTKFRQTYRGLEKDEELDNIEYNNFKTML